MSLEKSLESTIEKCCGCCCGGKKDEKSGKGEQ